MKGFQRWTAVSAIALTLAVPAVAAADEKGMMTAKIDYSKADVMMKDGMELVALRQLAESLGYTVTWDDTERSVTLTSGMTMGGGDKGMTDKQMNDKDMTDKSMTDTGMADKSMTDKGMADMGMTDKSMADMYTVKITVGSKTATIAMKEQMLTYAPVIVDNKTYVTKTFIDMYLAEHAMMMMK